MAPFTTVPITVDSNSGITSYGLSRVALFDDSILAAFQQYLEAHAPHVATALYEAGEQMGKTQSQQSMRDAFKAMTSGQALPAQSMSAANLRGFGHFSIDPDFNILTGEGTLRLKNSAIARFYPHKQAKPVCYLFAGSLAGSMSVSYHRDFLCEETKCLACGDAECEFHLTPVESAKKNFLVRFTTVIKKAFS